MSNLSKSVTKKLSFRLGDDIGITCDLTFYFDKYLGKYVAFGAEPYRDIMGTGETIFDCTLAWLNNRMNPPFKS